MQRRDPQWNRRYGGRVMLEVLKSFLKESSFEVPGFPFPPAYVGKTFYKTCPASLRTAEAYSKPS